MFVDDANLFSSHDNIKDLFNNVNLELNKIVVWFNDTRREKLCFAQFSIRVTACLLLTFFVCLHNQLRDDSRMTSMQIVQFSRPLTPLV